MYTRTCIRAICVVCTFVVCARLSPPPGTHCKIFWGLLTFAGFAFILTDCIFSQILLFESKITELRGVERKMDMRHISMYNYAFW